MKVIDGGKPMDRRRHQRRRTLLRARILSGRDQRPIECSIRGLSQSGASARIGPSTQLDDPLVLLDLTNGLAFRAKVVWRKGENVGLTFTAYSTIEDFDAQTAVASATKTA